MCVVCACVASEPKMVEAGAQASREAAAQTPPPASNLHLISWNVAGWKTTLEQIKRFEGALPAFLSRHHVDILCLQEVKISAKVLATDGVKLGAETPGYESYWACNEGSGAQRQGLNGVTTIARQGSVLRADSCPLQDPALDSEGRCLMTDHGAFVVFNVYVPNAGGGHRLPYKMRWLRALRAAMGRARAAGKAVILAGDLNMKNRVVDAHWTYRSLEPARLRDVAQQCADLSAEVAATIDTIATEWPFIASSLQAKEHKPFETRNSHSGQTFQRWGVFAKAKNGESVRLGPPMECEDYAKGSFYLGGAGVESDGTIVAGPEGANAEFTLRRPGVMSVGELVECLKQLSSVEVSPKALKAISAAHGRPPVATSIREWLQSVLQQDGMVDSFAALHPDADERFTCWEQYKNKRHTNTGSRIDYILVDGAFFQKHAQKGIDLMAFGREPDSAAAAAAAATLGGLSEPSSFAGGGMPTLEQDEYFAHFREAPSTGMVYTPPQLSDHIGVSLLLSEPPLVAGGGGTKDAATQKCQPHKSARRITDFFARKPSGDLPAAKRAK